MPFGPQEIETMSQTLSPSFARCYGLARVARVALAPQLTDQLGAFGLAPHLHDAAEQDRTAVPSHRGNAACGFRRIADRIPTQAGQQSDDCGQPMKAG